MKKRKLLMSIISNLVAFIVFFNVFAYVYAMQNMTIPWGHLWLAVPFFLTMPVRAKVSQLWLFLLLHFPLLLLPITAMGDVWTMIPITGLCIGMIIYSIDKKIRGEANMTGLTAVWIIALFAVLSMLYVAYLPYAYGAGILLNISSLICLAAVILFMHVDNMGLSMDLLAVNNKKSAHRTIPTNNVIMAIFLTIIIVFGALSVLFPSDMAMALLGNALLELLLFPLRIIVYLISLIQLQPLADPDMVVMPDLDFEGLEELEANESLANVLSIVTAIMRFLAAAVVIAVVAGFLIALFYRLYRAFRKKIRPEESLWATEDTVTKLEFSLGDLKELLPRFKIGIKHPLRRAYIKKVNSHIKQGTIIHKYHTTNVIANKIRPKENIDELTQKYEEIRYGRD